MEEKRKVYILTFHGLGVPQRPLAPGEERFWVDPSFFEAVLDAVKDRRDVKITFDDSNDSDFDVAFPALVSRGMQASFFVVSGRIDVPGFLRSQHIVELSRAGMTIGSHGTRHRPWAQLSTMGLREEVNESRDVLEDLLGREVSEAACPFGSYNRKVLAALRAARYTKVYTSDDGSALQGDWILPRNTIERHHSFQHVKRLIDPTPKTLPPFYRNAKLILKRVR